MEEVTFRLILLYLFVILLSIVLGITCYVLNAVGQYTVAKRRGIRNPWLAWIPVADTWILGCISDQYRYIVKGEHKSKRKILLGLNIGKAVCMLVYFVVFISFFIGIIGLASNNATEEDVLSHMLGMFGSMLLLYVPMLAIWIIHLVFHFMAMYDLYTSCTPDNNVLFLMLSILLGISPFIIFFIRHKDGGMPPRREPVSYMPQYGQWQPQPQQQYSQSDPYTQPLQYPLNEPTVDSTPEDGFDP